MDIPTLIEELEAASFAQRAKVAEAIAAAGDEAVVKQVGRLLVHPSQNVRLGAIEILATARFRPALGVMLEIARKRVGQERVFAARAVAHLAEPADRDRVEPAARAWLAAGDEFLLAHAEAALVAVGADVAAAVQASAPPPPPEPVAAPGAGITAPDPSIRHPAIARLRSAPDPVGHIVLGLRETAHAGVRLDLLAELERMGGDALARAALTLMPRLDGDIAALLARSLTRNARALPAGKLSEIRAAVDQTWRNLAGEPLAREALTECLAALPAP